MERNTPISVSNEPTYLAWSIFNTLCCCLPIGIAAIVYSSRTDTANTIGDSARANEHSRMARNLNIAGMVIGVIILILYIIYYSTQRINTD